MRTVKQDEWKCRGEFRQYFKMYLNADRDLRRYWYGASAYYKCAFKQPVHRTAYRTDFQVFIFEMTKDFYEMNT